MRNILYCLLIIIAFIIMVMNFSKIETLVNTITDSNFYNIEHLKSKLDGVKYYIQSDYPDKEEAANMLAEYNNIILNFISDMEKRYPNDPRVKLMRERYNPKEIYEGNPINNKDSTSYSISKGEKIVFCLRSKKNKKFHDKNLIMYVILHELAHLASTTYGHNAEFNQAFNWIAQNARDMGYYKYINFTMQPK